MANQSLEEKLARWSDSKITYLAEAGIEFKNGFPVIPKEAYYTGIPHDIQTYQFRNNVKENMRSKTLICYFSNDNHLIQRFSKIDDEISELKQYAGICGFDFSVSIGMPRPIQRSCLLVNAVFNCYVALHGIKILPNCRVGDMGCMNILDTFQPNSNIISGELGCKRNGGLKYGMHQLHIIQTRIAPNILFAYGSMPEKDMRAACGFKPQKFAIYPSNRDKQRNHKKAYAALWDGHKAHKKSIEDFIKDGGEFHVGKDIV